MYPSNVHQAPDVGETMENSWTKCTHKKQFLPLKALIWFILVEFLLQPIKKKKKKILPKKCLNFPKFFPRNKNY